MTKMSKLNQRLSVTLGSLIVLYVLSIALHAAGRDTNISSVSFHVDTAAVTEIDLYPHRAERQKLVLSRASGHWRIRYGSVEAEPEAGSAEALLGSLEDIPTRRLVSRSKDRWDEFKVGDTSGTRVVVYKGKEPVADYYVGSGSTAGGPLTGGPYAGGASYLRENGHDEAYAVDGYLHPMVDRTFADWRDKSLLRLNTANLTGISFEGTPGFALMKKDSTWWLNGGRLSTDSVNRYLSRLQSYDLDHFADDFAASAAPDRSILFSGGPAPATTVRAWRRPDGGWIVNSTQNPDGYFSITDSVMMRDFWR
ncbi:MAG TPA: DUF4340 domain-containing protein, partial [Puia sp.]|nr:DUF4340 domain-containing protein [Puia sp.]